MERTYHLGDSAGYDVVFIAVNDPEASKEIRDDARSFGKLVTLQTNRNFVIFTWDPLCRRVVLKSGFLRTESHQLLPSD
jgi:hypothetical protein